MSDSYEGYQLNDVDQRCAFELKVRPFNPPQADFFKATLNDTDLDVDWRDCGRLGEYEPVLTNPD